MAKAKRPQMPRDELIEVAIHWLENNEGDGIEAEACTAVAEWLDHEKNERWLRATAHSAGIPVARLRRKLAENAK